MKRKYLLLSLSCMVVLVILTIVGTTLALPAKGAPRQDKEYISLEDLYPAQAQFSQSTFNGTWISETEIWYARNGSNFYIFNAQSGTSELFISASELSETLNTTSVTLSQDKSSLLARSDPEQGYRHSSTARYAIYDIQSSEIIRIANHERLQFCEFIGETNNSVVFVLENNLYVKFGLHGDEIQITDDGIPGVIYNGIPDWVYEEEVLGSGSAVWFSPSYAKVAFASFNDTLVDEVVFTTYGKPGTIEDQYPILNRLRYPKVGTTNPTVTLRITNLEEGQLNTIIIPAPESDVTDDHILYTVSWISEDELVAVWTNRRQNKSVTVICNPNTGACQTDLIREEPDGWIEVYTPKFSDDGSTYLSIDPVTPTGAEEWDQWYHLVRFTKGGVETKQPTPLTFGRKTVSSIVGWNQSTNRIYYIGTREGLPWEQHLYVVSGNMETCISCEVTLPGGQRCTFASAWAPRHATFYTMACQSDGVPAVTAVYDSQTDQPIFVWQDNAALRETLAKYHLPEQKLLLHEIPTTNATVQFFLPSQFDENDLDTTYPMVVHIYVGPNSVGVYDRFSFGYHTYMATNRSIIYCRIDGRGTGNKGKRALFAVNNALGSYEVEDVIDVTKQLTDMFPWIDKTRIGLWGWSYGGYATAMAITKDEEHVFKCGLSVAPVISWLYYDTIYTERYMGLPTPEDNLIGYEESDVSKKAINMKNHRWMLIHGNADDNVHYQNAMAMARALQLLDIPFEIMSYPDEAHGLSGVSRHVYHTIDEFWTNCFASDLENEGAAKIIVSKVNGDPHRSFYG